LGAAIGAGCHWGRAKTSNWNYAEKVEKVVLFWVHIAILKAKKQIIGGPFFPQSKSPLAGFGGATLCHRTHGGFDTFDKRCPVPSAILAFYLLSRLASMSARAA
jgi:hypothetical protein